MKFKQVLSLLAALSAGAVGFWLCWTAAAVDTQFGVGLILLLIAPNVLEEGKDES